ncbi:MAG: EAL domain-containing protein [Methylobacter sp.]|nr:EAL domain-containing protein [Methylobacter sp.]
MSRIDQSPVHLADDAEYLSQLAYHSADGSLVVDHEGDVLFANPAAEKLFGRYGDELVNNPFGFPVVDGDRTEVDILRADGTTTVAEMRVTEVTRDGQALFVVTLRDTTERKHREEQLRIFKRAVNCSNNGILITDASQQDHPLVYVNPAFERITGYESAEALGREVFFMPHNDQDEPEVERLRKALLEQREEKALLRNYRKNGVLFWNGLHIAPVLDDEDKITHYVCIQNDLTELKEAEQRGRLAARVFEHTSEGIIITDLESHIVDINPAFTVVTGYERDEVIGKNPNILSSHWQEPTFYKKMWETIQKAGQWQGEIWNRRKNGETYAEWLSICAIKDEHGQTVNYVGQFSDITVRKQMEEGLHRMAYYDDLTRLPNRSMLWENLRLAIARSERQNSKVALMFVDLDRFKIVNDTLGHHVGDMLIAAVARRLKESMRDGDFVARLGGDEFTVVLEDCADNSAVATTAQKIVDALHLPFQLEGHEVFISSSIGISLFPDDASDLNALLISADSTMYRAKEMGGDNYQFYSEKVRIPAKDRLSLENELRHALARDELRVYYQPIVDVRSGLIISAEALLRWQHPERGLVSPDNFIPLAEETGLIVPIGEWVLHTVSAQSKVWRKNLGINIPIAVNLSGRQLLNQSSSFDSLVQIVKEASLSSIRLYFEITESVLIDYGKSAHTLLESLKDHGIGLMLDDFGTGYSSLTHLRRFPIDGVKIDRSFVSNLENDPNDAAIVKAILVMAQSLGLRVVAEGVETEQQRLFLAEYEGIEGQGFYFSRPVCVTEMTELLTRGSLAEPLSSKE